MRKPKQLFLIPLHLFPINKKLLLEKKLYKWLVKNSDRFETKKFNRKLKLYNKLVK